MTNGQPTVLTTSRRLERHPQLDVFLDHAVILATTRAEPAAQAVLAWGRKPSALKAERLSQQLQLPLWRLEDGFIHSLGQGVLGSRSYSLVVDTKGIYYDATQPSALEQLLAQDQGEQLTPAVLARAERLMARLVKERITKYNNTPLTTQLDLPTGKKVLVVDQTAGDMSLQYGLVTEEIAEHMLQAALADYPDATIVLKTHPDVIAGKKRGCFRLPLPNARIQVVTTSINPYVLLAQVDQVYTLTSQLGFEALLAGKKVTCFGMPFYAGWGLTDDRADASHTVFQRRLKQRSLVEVFAAAYLLYSRYVHPDTHQRCELEAVLDYISLQKRLFAETQGDLYCFGFTAWKRNYIRRFLYSPQQLRHFVWTPKQALSKGIQAEGHIMAWGERAILSAQHLATLCKTEVWRIEDGFIRSAGLGSDYAPPLSLVLDKRGIYYDPTQPSDLEYLLQNSDFTAELLQRARDLREMLLQQRVSKYNLGVEPVQERIQTSLNQRILLVPGQVEDDASIRKGCIDLKTNTDLLIAVRQAYPEAYIIFKPHPDVVSGNRKGRVAATALQQYADLVLEDANIIDCLEVADEVHTLTSLTGFEGLLRHKRVVCYGLPFYAGWGLTKDRHSLPRRTRRLTLDQLVAATLILYPRYINWETGAFTTPEYALHCLSRDLQAQGGRQKNKINSLNRLWRKANYLCRGFLYFRY